jgi:hypothetical protein
MPSHCPQATVQTDFWVRLLQLLILNGSTPNLSQKLASTGTVDPSNAAALLQIIDMDNMKYVKLWQCHLIARK